MLTLALACNDQGPEIEEAGNDKKALQDSLYKVVDRGHNEGMAKYGKLNRSITEVQRALDSINKLQASKVDTAYRRRLLALQEDLSYALMSMDKWMTEFKHDSAEGNPDQRIDYLESEAAKVTKVRDNILNSLQRADSLLKK